MEIRFHNPYRHAVLGLLTEIATFIAFVIVVAMLALAASWIA